MKITFLLLFTFSLSLAFSQNMELQPLPEKPSKFTFGWVYSPEVSFRVLSEGSEPYGLTQLTLEIREDSEQAKFGQSFSVFGGYQISKAFSIEAGMGYTDFGEGRKSMDLFSWAEPETIYGTVKGSNHLHVASLPITAHINLGGKKVKGFISAGIAPGILMRYTTKSYFDYTDGSTSADNNYSAGLQDFYSKFILGAHISGGIEYQYSNKTTVRIAPVFRMTTNSVYSTNQINGHYYNAGIEFGTIYKL